MADILETVLGGSSSSPAPSGDILDTVLGSKNVPVKAPAVKAPVASTPAPKTDITKLVADTKAPDTSKMFGNFFSSTPIAPSVSMNISKSTPSILTQPKEVNPYNIPSETKPIGDTISEAKPQSLWDKITTKINDTLFNESPERDSASRAVQSVVVDNQLVDIAKQLKFYDNFKSATPTGNAIVDTANQNKAVVAYMKNNWDDLKKSLTNPDALPAHPEMLGPTFSDVSKNLDAYTKAMGVRSTPTNQEVIATGLAIPIVGSLIDAPIAGLIGLAAFQGLSQVEHYFLGDTIAGKVSDQLGLNSGTKDILNLIEMFAEGELLHQVYLKAPDVARAFTKDIVTKYEPGKTVYFSGDQIRDIWQTGKLLTDAEKSDILKIIPEDKKDAFKNGITVDIPPEKILTLVDKPYWAKIKDMLNIRSGVPQEVSRETFGETKVGAEQRPNRLLGEGTAKTRAMVDTLQTEIQKNLETHGADVVHQTLMDKLGVDAQTADKLINTSKTSSALLDVKKTSEEVLGTVVPSVKIPNVVEHLFSPSKSTNQPVRTTDVQGKTVEQQFIRPSTKIEQTSPTAKSRGYNTIPDKVGFEKVYKPYGEQGVGYYYSRVVQEIPAELNQFINVAKQYGSAEAFQNHITSQTYQSKGGDYFITTVVDAKTGVSTPYISKIVDGSAKKIMPVEDFYKEAINSETPKTQKEIVSETVKEKPLSIKEIAKQTKILEPNIRRILGQGTKEGVFERVKEGVYVLKTKTGNFAYVEMGDAVDSLARMADEGLKFDSVILDPAYYSRALIGGNRGIKQWNFIMPTEFAKVMDSVSKLVKGDDTHVYLMLSGARTAQPDMDKYVKGAIDADFKVVGEGKFTKLFQNGEPVTNVRGEVAASERMILMTKSGSARAGEIEKSLDFKFIRPLIAKSYQTEKPAELMKALITQSTLEGETVLDPFGGSGVSGAEALKAKRNAVIIEKQASTVENYTKPRIEDTMKALEDWVVPKKEPQGDGTVMLTSGIDPGLDQFLKDDVMPTTKKGVAMLTNIMRGAVHLAAPTHGVRQVDLDQIMKMKGARDKQEYIFAKTHEIIKKNFDNMPQSKQIDFVDRMKKGLAQPTPALQAVADALRTIDTDMWNRAKVYKPTLAWKENHFRVLWKTIPGSPETQKGFSGLFRRPLQGTKGFTKQSTLSDMSEGIAKGGVPYTYNPMDMFALAYADMNKFITAQEMIAGLKETKQMRFTRFGKSAPAGFVRIDDSVSKVYMPTEVGLPAQTGEWYVEENVGRILNNFLSKDHIRSSDLGRGLLAIKNAYTAVELALSPFHAVFESLETMGSNIGLGIQKMTQGEVVGGLKDVLKAPVAPYSTAHLGTQAIKYLTEKDFINTPAGKSFVKKFPNAAELLDDLFIGGGKMKMDQGYQITTTETFLANVQSGNYIGAMFRLLPSLNKTLTKPLFEIYIPRLKIGTFLSEYSNDIVANSKALAAGEVTRGKLARDRWNFVEDRFGEMNFDNLFWNKTFKTGIQIMFRSATWKIGNLRATGGAIWGQGKEFFNAARQGRAPKMNPKMAWLLGMSIVTAIIGYTVQKMMTGKNPTGVKDIIYPQIDAKGNRISTPTYWKDAFHLANDPAGYVTSSLSGDVDRMVEVWQNKDFYGTEVMNSNDPFYKRAVEGMVHMVPVPFNVSSSMSLAQSGAPVSAQALSFMGFTKAPAYINSTNMQNRIYDLYGKRNDGTKSIEDAATAKQKSDIKKAYQNGDIKKANTLLDQAVKGGIIKQSSMAQFIKDADLPGDIKAFRLLPATDQRALIKDMTPDEINRYGWYTTSDVKSSFSEISDNASNFVQGVKDGDIKQPVFKMGAEVSDNATTPTFKNNSETSSQGIISRVVNYAKAIGTDPVTAFQRIFTGQTIRAVENGTIIVERMSFADSSSIKKAEGGGSGMNLDHIVPLEAGGDNSKDNLQLIPQAQWKSNTAVENYLGSQIKAGNLTGKQARELAIRFKAGLGEKLSPSLMQEYNDKYGGKPLTEQEVYAYEFNK